MTLRQISGLVVMLLPVWILLVSKWRNIDWVAAAWAVLSVALFIGWAVLWPWLLLGGAQ